MTNPCLSLPDPCLSFTFHFSNQLIISNYFHTVYSPQSINMPLDLSWQNFSQHLKGLLEEVLTSKDFTDVTIISEDQEQFRAHKMVLSASSPVFRNIINCLPAKDPVIYLKGVKQEEMKSILEFIYVGQASFSEERLQEFLKAAKVLEIKEISGNENEKSENIAESTKPSITQTVEGSSNPSDVVKYEKEMNEISDMNMSPQKLSESNDLTAPEDFHHNSSDLILVRAEEYACNLCGAQFLNRYELRKHTIKCGNKVKEPDASIIEFEFLHKSNSKSHSSHEPSVLLTHGRRFRYHKNTFNRAEDTFWYVCGAKHDGCTARATVRLVSTIDEEEGCPALVFNLVDVTAPEGHNHNETVAAIEANVICEKMKEVVEKNIRIPSKTIMKNILNSELPKYEPKLKEEIVATFPSRLESTLDKHRRKIVGKSSTITRTDFSPDLSKQPKVICKWIKT